MAVRCHQRGVGEQSPGRARAPAMARVESRILIVRHVASSRNDGARHEFTDPARPPSVRHVHTYAGRTHPVRTYVGAPATGDARMRAAGCWSGSHSVNV